MHVSTAYVAGDAHGAFTEADRDVGQGFRKTYERTELEAELAVAGAIEELSGVVVRPSIVDIVPADYVADAIGHLLRPRRARPRRDRAGPDRRVLRRAHGLRRTSCLGTSADEPLDSARARPVRAAA